MARIFAFLAVLALLISPVTAAAAQQACARDMPQMMSGMPKAMAAHDRSSPSDPCCDHSKKAPHGDMACAQVCATMCAVSVALPLATLDIPALHSTQVYSLQAQTLRAHSPPRAERPPKLIA
jgi:hypothetical protein